MSIKENIILSSYTEARCSNYIYYNAIFNNVTTGLQPLEINDRRSDPLIDTGLRFRYTGSVKRFLIDSFLIPLTIIHNESDYVITFVNKANGGPYPSPLLFKPSNTSNIFPLNRAIFSVEQFVSILNDTLFKCYTDYNTGETLTPLFFCPFFIYNGLTLTLICPFDQIYPNKIDGCQIFISTKLFTLLGAGCNYQFISGQSPKDVLLLGKSLGNNINPANTFYTEFTSGTPPTFPTLINSKSLSMPFTESALVSVTTINHILLQANQTEVRGQIYGTNIRFQTTLSGDIIANKNNLQFQIIEDYIYIPNGRGKILFEPQIDRPFNLLSDRPITEFSFKCLYMDNDLSTYQVLTIPGSTSDFKFGFQEDFFQNNSGILVTIYNLLDKATKKLRLN